MGFASIRQAAAVFFTSVAQAQAGLRALAGPRLRVAAGLVAAGVGLAGCHPSAGAGPAAAGPPPRPGTRVTGELPFDKTYLTNRQAPAYPLLTAVLGGGDAGDEHGEPTQYFGALFPNPQVYQAFVPGTAPTVDYLEIYNTRTQGEWTGPFQVFGVKADGQQVELLRYTGKLAGEPVRRYAVAPAPYVGLLYQLSGTRVPNRIVVHGTYTAVAPRAVPALKKYPLGNHTGVVAHSYSLLQDINTGDCGRLYEPAYAILKKLKGAREYWDTEEFNRVRGEFRWDNSWNGRNLDALLTRPKADGVHVVVCVQGMPAWMRAGYPNPDANGERVPVPYGDSRLLPAAWEDFAETVAQVTYRYGHNAKIPAALVKSKEGFFYPTAPAAGAYVKRIGLGVLDEIEPYNEVDKSWKGSESYASGEEMAVCLGVVWQKIKRYNPGMQITYPGLASFRPDVLQDFEAAAMRRWGFIPIDNYAVHFYPSTGGGQHAASPSAGQAIELSDTQQLLADFQRADYLRLGNKPVDVGEVGYDLTTNSPLRAVVPAGSAYTQAEWAGVLYLRVALWNAKHGLRRTYHYEWGDNAPTNQYTQFSAMGLTTTSGPDGAKVLVARPAANLLMQLNAQFGTFTHDRQLSASPLVDRWLNPAGQVLLSLHLPTERNATGTYAVRLPKGGQLYRFNLHQDTPTRTALPAGTTTVQVTELPCFVVLNH